MNKRRLGLYLKVCYKDYKQGGTESLLNQNNKTKFSLNKTKGTIDIM